MELIDLLVPVGIFVVGIIVSLSCASTGQLRLIEARKSAQQDLMSTKAYAQPFTDSQGRG